MNVIFAIDDSPYQTTWQDIKGHTQGKNLTDVKFATKDL